MASAAALSANNPNGRVGAGHPSQSGPDPTMAAQNWLPLSSRSPIQTHRGTVSDPGVAN